MKKLVRCACKSHCRPFNTESHSFEGDGEWIPKSTAHNHRIDDQMAESLDIFAENVTARVLGSPPQELPEPDPMEDPQDEEVVLKMELAY